MCVVVELRTKTLFSQRAFNLLVFFFRFLINSKANADFFIFLDFSDAHDCVPPFKIIMNCIYYIVNTISIQQRIKDISTKK